MTRSPRRNLRRSTIAVHAVLCLLGAAGGCTSKSASPPRPRGPSEGAAFSTFTDITLRTGLALERDDGHDGESWRVVETVNGGAAIADFDGDGRLDIFITNARRPGPNAPPAPDVLYRARDDGTYVESAREVGVDDDGVSLGCAVADIDADGDADLYVTRLGPNRLCINDGRGHFEEAAAPAGVAGEAMSSGCAFFDADADGDLDLYVASYVNDTKREHPPALLRGVASYWPPLNYEAAPDFLYLNRGDGTFEDASEASGIRAPAPERGLGVLAGDFDDDGQADIFVANDMGANFLFLGQGGGRFSEEGFFRGTALGETGDVLGSMGVESGDFDGDGRADFVVTNYQTQVNNLYRALGSGGYVDDGGTTGFALGSLNEVAWGIVFADLDLDGALDLFVANGHLNPEAERMNDGSRFAQKNRVFRYDGTRFVDVSEDAGEALRQEHVSRGVAAGDLDGDGDLDLLVVNARGRPQLLRNDAPKGRHWLQVRLVGAGANRDAIGARVKVVADGLELVRERRSSGSYLSSHAPDLHFGLGERSAVDHVEVIWPRGSRSRLENPAVDRTHVLAEE